MKTLFKFTKNKTEIVKQENITKGEDGKDITTIEEAKKETPFQFAIIKPNRECQDNAEIFYNVSFAKAVKSGQITRTELLKRIKNDNGLFSDIELKRLDELKANLLKTQEEYTLLRLKKDDERTEDDKKRADVLNSI